MIPTQVAVCPKGQAPIPGGAYSHESELRNVDAFCLDRREVTVADYRACVDAKKCSTEALACDSLSTWGVAGYDDHPVNCVDYLQARDYCAFRNERLPTHEEWEWAARGGANGWKFPWGNDAPNDQRACWGGNHMRDSTCAVAQFPADSFGLYDMAGNVWEITAANEDGYIYRGGSFATDDELRMSAAFECNVELQHREEYVGFRCASDRGTK